MTQPEPESGAWQDQHGHVWVSTTSGMWGSVTGGRYMFWGNLVDDRGPMTPLLPAERPDNVPEDAVPFVGWVVRTGPDKLQALAPDGSRWSNAMSEDVARVYRFPVPPKPEPTLANLLRGRPVTRDDCGSRWVMIPADLRDEAADALEDR